MSNLVLMKQVFTRCGGTLRAATAGANVPEAFLAALVAGESGGDANAKRFEKNVLASLWEVLLGRKTAFGSISGTDVAKYVLPAQILSVPAMLPPAVANLCYQRLDELATSWGLAQIMGYHVLEVGKTVDTLRDPRGNLDFAIALLERFAAQFHLNVGQNFPELLRCWNTGRPDGKTFDPQYVQNGMERMNLWPEVLNAMNAAQS